MTVYVVTYGEYSEYGIEKIFSNRAAAEEYKKWHNLSNDIEEYELEDVAFKPIDEQKKAMFIRARGAVYPEGVVDLQYDIHPCVVYETTQRKCAGILSTGFPSGIFGVYVYWYIDSDKWDEELYKNRITKALYDYAGIAKSMFADGATGTMVSEALHNEVGKED